MLCRMRMVRSMARICFGKDLPACPWPFGEAEVPSSTVQVMFMITRRILRANELTAPILFAW